MAPKRTVLSERLQMLADLVTKGSRVVDVGCDHAYLSIYLVENGISPSALAMDVRKGPLSAAQEHIRQSGYETLVKTRLSDGLQEYLPGEADTCICAGMGGPLMCKILRDSFEKVKTLQELILQPQSEIREFRAFLRQNGLAILEERCLVEDEKYYFAMRVAFAGEMDASKYGEADWELFDAYGEHLLKTKNPVLLKFLEKRLLVCRELEQNLEHKMDEANRLEEDSDAIKRLRGRRFEIQTEASKIQRALAYFERAVEMH